MSNIIRRFLQILRRFAYKRRLGKKITNTDWRSNLAKLEYPTEEVEQTDKGWIRLQNIDLDLPPTETAMGLISAVPLIKDLRRCKGVEIRWNSEMGELFVEHGNEIYPVQSYEELYILQEIFFQGEYGLFPNNPTLLFDIGANVGFSSIYFAGKLQDAIIYAFEPLPRNYARACRNFELNSHLAGRIKIQPYGLHDSDAKMVMQSESENPGRSSVVLNRSDGAQGAVEAVEIDVRDAARELSYIIRQHPDRAVWMKMDCEGSEFAILQNLVDRNVAGDIKGMVLEWHRLSDDMDIVSELQAILRPAGFHLYVRGADVRMALDGIAVAVR